MWIRIIWQLLFSKLDMFAFKMLRVNSKKNAFNPVQTNGIFMVHCIYIRVPDTDSSTSTTGRAHYSQLISE